MAETKTTSTRGRKSKEVVKDINIKETKNEEVSISDLMAKLEEQAKQMAELQNKVNATTKEKSTLETLVKTLKSNDNKEGTRNLPKKVKLVSLIPNKYNLTTEDGGHGKIFTFEGIGDIVTIKTSELEDVLSVQSYRKQAEKGMFYILDKDVVDDQDLTEAYEKICNKDIINRVVNLIDDTSVDIFCGLCQEMKDSISTQMAENINNGVKLDRNRIADIKARADIDIEDIAKALKINESKM